MGDTVRTTPLNSCCLLVTWTFPCHFYAQHCGGTDWSNLSPRLFPPGDEVTHALMVTGRKTPYQIGQAHALQLTYRSARLVYYAWKANDNYPMPEVKIREDGLALLGEEYYEPVAF